MMKKSFICNHCGHDVEIEISESPQMTEESIKEVFDGMAELLAKKNRDYKGASFDLGLQGNMVHLWDKVNRYRNLVNGADSHFESIEDTLKDIIGYAVIGLHILKSENK